MTTIFIVQGVHQVVPGNVLKLYADKAGADAGAAELVNIILADLELPANATAETWEAKLGEARQKRADDLGVDLDDLDEEDTGDVWITEEPLIGAAPPPAAPASDAERLDWLQSRIVDTVYLDDGKIIDVRGGDFRKAIDAAKSKWPTTAEQDDGAEAIAAEDSTIGQDDRALAEGWCLIEDAGGLLRIEADSDSDIFSPGGVSHDDQAEAFVKQKAAEGSSYHIAALARVGRPG